MADGKLNYEINFSINKASYNNIIQELNKTMKAATGALSTSTANKEDMQYTLNAAKDLKKIFESSWNSKLNQLDLSKVNNDIHKTFGSVKNLKDALDNSGATGAHAYNLFSREILNTNLQLSKSSKLLDDMADTLSKTIKWGIASRAMNSMVGSIQKAWSFSVNLDKSLNDIRIVTGKSAEEMEKFAVRANAAAKALGASTRDYTEASLIYYQQGLSEKEAQERAEITLKAANVTGQSAKQVSEQLTAVWNGYNVAIQESELYVDKLAAVAASTASNLEELSTGMSKVASSAAVMGVDIDQLNAQMATIISVTRQAPESVGTALRTIYARMGDIKAGLDGETTLGNYTAKMAALGINVLNASGNLRDMGEVVEEVGRKWESMTKEQQVSLAQTMAGTRQYNNLLSLFNNWDMYTEALETSAHAAGTLQKQQDIYMESTEAHLQKMRTEAERTYEILFDTKTVNNFIDAFTGLNGVLNTFLKSLGGGMNDFVYFGSLLTNIFNKQIAGGIENTIQKFNDWRENRAKLDLMSGIANAGIATSGLNRDQTQDIQEDFKRAQQILSIKRNISNEDFNSLNTLRQEIFAYEQILKKLNEEDTIKKEHIETAESERLTLIEIQNEYSKLQVEELKSNDVYQDKHRLINKTLNLIKEENEELAKRKLLELQNSVGDEDQQDKLFKEMQAYIAKSIIDKNKEIEKLNKNLGKSATEIENLKNQSKEAFEKGFNTKKAASDMTDLVTTISSLTQVTTILSGALKIVSDEEASVGEKTTQLLSLLPSLIFGVTQLSTVIMSNPYLVLGAAAIAAIAVTIGVTANEISLLTDKQRILNEELERNKKIVEETNKKYEDLRNTISNYNSAKEGLSKLTEGTLEFYDAIVKANDEAQKLIEAFELQAGSQYQIDSNGLITINEDALKQGMFNQGQQRYRAQFNQSLSQYGINQNARDKEIVNLTKEFQKNVSNRVENGYGISYEQAKEMIDTYRLSENDVVISIGELEKQVITNNTKNIDDLCVLITEEMSSIKDVIQLNEAKEKAERQQLGIQSIRGFGTQEEIENFDKLSGNLKLAIQDSLGKLETDTYDERKEAGRLGRNITNPLEHAIGLYGNKIGAFVGSRLLGPLGAIGGWLGGNLFGNTLKQQQIDYNETKNLEKQITENSLSEMIKEVNYRLNNANLGGYKTGEGAEYIAESQFQAIQQGTVDASLLNKMTAKELDFAINTSSELAAISEAVDIYNSKMNESAEVVDQWGRNQARIAADLQEYTGVLHSAAEQLGVSTTTMDLYGDAVLNASKEEKRKNTTTAEEIASLAKFNKAYNEAINLYEDNKDALEDYANAINNHLVPSLEAAEGAAEIVDKLKEMGLTLSGTDLAQNLDTINTLLTGTEEEAKAAYDALEKLSYMNVLVNFDTSSFDDFENGIEGFAEYLSTLNPGAQIESEYATALTNMINASQMTREQIFELLDSLHLRGPNMDMKVNKKKDKIADKKVEHIRYEGTIPLLSAFGKDILTKKIDFQVTKTTDPVEADYYTLGEGQVYESTASTGSFSKSPSNARSGGSDSRKTVDQNNEVADIYHQVNTQIEKVENAMKKLQSQTKKLVGADLIENLNDQWKDLNIQVQNYNEKLRIAQGEQAQLRNKLASQGVAFNADGTIGNYVQAFQAQQAQLNNIINYYNSLSSEGQKSYQSVLDAAQDNFKQFQKDMDRYDEIVSDFIPDLYQSIQDAIDKQIDIQIQEFDMEIELRLKMSKAERDWNEFKKKIIDGIEDDDILGNAMAKLVDFSTYYDENNTGAIQALRKQINDTLNELYQMDAGKTSNVYGDNRNSALEDLKKYYDELMSQMKDILALQKEIHKSYIDMMNEAQDKFDKQIESYGMITSLIEHDMNVISMVYGKEAYHQLSDYYNQQQANFDSQLDFQKQQVEFWQEQMNAVEAGTDEWDTARDKWEQATNDLNDLIEKSIQNIQDKYLNTINAIFQDLNNKVTDNLGLDYVEEEWNLINKNADQYLDTINAMYGVQSLQNKYLDAINSTDNINTQKQLKKIMDEELKDLRERDKLTEYDIERANKKYEIALKQIALEEAQQNKTQLRLRRDSQGNYRYEYVNDMNEIQQLQNDLNDLYNSLYNFDKEHYASNLNQLYDTWKEFQEKMAEAAQINDPEARAERELLIQEQYGDLINSINEQNQNIRTNLYDSAFEDLSRLYEEDKNKFLEMTKEEQDAIMVDLIPAWDKGVQHMADVFTGEGGFIPVCKDAFEELNNATQDYENSLLQVQDTADVSFNDIANGVDSVITKTQDLISDNERLIDTYRGEMSAIGEVVNSLDSLVEQYDEAARAAKDAETAAHDYWMEQQRQSAEAARKEQEERDRKAAEAAAARTTPSNSPSLITVPGGINGGGDGNLVVGDTATFTGSYYSTSYGEGNTGSLYSGVAQGIVVDKITNNPFGIHIHSADGRYPDLGWIKRSQLSGYDTGGYTGEWGNTGRLALLHQKELVLNAQDTQNILGAVNIMRTITDTLGNKIFNRLANATAGNPFGENGFDNMLNQNVHIEAQFPNVTNSHEIEDALNNLVNMAAQRAQIKER